MKITFDDDSVSIIAESDEEAGLLGPIAEAINRNSANVPVCLFDNLENGPENRIINAVLELRVRGRCFHLQFLEPGKVPFSSSGTR